jgi:hypothetical protein
VTDPATVAKAYMHAWVSKDFRTLRGLLADDVTFSGPFAQLDNADACLDGQARSPASGSRSIRARCCRRRLTTSRARRERDRPHPTVTCCLSNAM